MSKYHIVYENDKPINNNKKLNNIYDAATYMYYWAFPVPWDTAKKIARKLVDSGYIKPNKVIDMGMGEVTVLMKIVEIGK